MHAIVVLVSKADRDVSCRLVDGTFEPALSPPIALRFDASALEDDAAFLGGRQPRSLPGAGCFIALSGVAIEVSTDGTPALVARSVADLVAVTSPDFRPIAWSDVEETVAAQRARSQPDEGILYVDAAGEAFVADSIGAYLRSTGREHWRTARECSLDGAPLPTGPGFYHFTGEPWSFVDIQAIAPEHTWGMTVQAYVPLTDAHRPAFGRASMADLEAVAAMPAPQAGPGPSPSV